MSTRRITGKTIELRSDNEVKGPFPDTFMPSVKSIRPPVKTKAYVLRTVGTDITVPASTTASLGWEQNVESRDVWGGKGPSAYYPGLAPTGHANGATVVPFSGLGGCNLNGQLLLFTCTDAAAPATSTVASISMASFRAILGFNDSANNNRVPNVEGWALIPCSLPVSQTVRQMVNINGVPPNTMSYQHTTLPFNFSVPSETGDPVALKNYSFILSISNDTNQPLRVRAILVLEV